MQNCLVAETAQTCMAMYDLNLLAEDNVAKDRKEGEDGWKGRRAVDNKKGNVVDFEAIGKIPNTSPAVVSMRDDDDFVASVYELCRELVDMAFDSSWLGKEVVADHGNIVRHREKSAGCALRIAASQYNPHAWSIHRPMTEVQLAVSRVVSGVMTLLVRLHTSRENANSRPP